MQLAAARRLRENAWLWLAKLASGVLIFAILVVHLVVNHFVAPNGLLSYADILAYYANPLIPLMEGVFLVFVVSHALLGLRGLVFKSHGSADAYAFEQALARAYDAARNRLIDRVQDRLARMAPLGASPSAPLPAPAPPASTPDPTARAA